MLFSFRLSTVYYCFLFVSTVLFFCVFCVILLLRSLRYVWLFLRYVVVVVFLVCLCPPCIPLRSSCLGVRISLTIVQMPALETRKQHARAQRPYKLRDHVVYAWWPYLCAPPCAHTTCLL